MIFEMADRIELTPARELAIAERWQVFLPWCAADTKGKDNPFVELECLRRLHRRRYLSLLIMGIGTGLISRDDLDDPRRTEQAYRDATYDILHRKRIYGKHQRSSYDKHRNRGESSAVGGGAEADNPGAV